MAKILLAIVFLCGLSLTSAQEASLCPPAEILAPCTCSETTRTIECKSIAGRFNIKQIFDNVSPLIDEAVVFDKLVVSQTSLIEFPSKGIEHLKFSEIEIISNPNLEYIYKDAFVATTNVTRVLKLYSNHLTNVGAEERDIYDFVNQFNHLQTLSISSNALTSIPLNALDNLVDLTVLSLSQKSLKEIPSGALNLPSLIKLDLYSSGLTAIPDNGFGNLPSLETLDAQFSSLSYIGKEAFASSPKLNTTKLAYNPLGEDSFHPDAFKGMAPGARVDMEFCGIGYLKEEVFKPLLDNAQAVWIGGTTCNRNGCNSRYLQCDERIDWMCDNASYYETILKGYLCSTIGGNVWGYCSNLSSRNV